MHVSVITATIGTPLLVQAVESVLAQTHGDLDLTVVVDGPKWRDQTRDLLASIKDDRLHVMELPYATGEGFNAHRIYGAMSFLARADTLMYLDEDNWLAANHVESLVAVMDAGRHDWVFALRQVHDRDGTYICHDNCESLGPWAGVLDEQDFLVDVNCYFLARRVALHAANLWYRPVKMGVDRVLYDFLSRTYPNFACSGAYTLHYRTDAPRDGSVDGDFFQKGNMLMSRLYPDGFPWASQVTRHSDLKSP